MLTTSRVLLSDVAEHAAQMKTKLLLLVGQICNALLVSPALHLALVHLDPAVLQQRLHLLFSQPGLLLHLGLQRLHLDRPGTALCINAQFSLDISFLFLTYKLLFFRENKCFYLGIMSPHPSISFIQT